MPASYKIPQNVDLEDKIFGPLTLKQFFVALGAGLATFISFSALNPLSPPLFFVVAFFIWVTAVAFIFVRPNDQPFSKFAYSFINFLMKPQRRVWKRIPSLGEITLTDSGPAPVVAPSAPDPEEVRSRLQQLAHIVDTRGWSNVDELGNRVTGGEHVQRYNISMPASDTPEDVLAGEDDGTGPDRASRELDRVIRQGVHKPTLKTAAGARSKDA